MKKFLAVVTLLARKLASKDEPGFTTRLTYLVMALCVLVALLRPLLL